MGRRLPQIFFVLSLASLVLLLAACGRRARRPGRPISAAFFQLEAQGEPNAAAKAAVLATPPEIHQVMLTGLQRVDRCTTCHLGVDDPTMKNAPEPFRYHEGLGPHIPSQVRLHHLPRWPGPRHRQRRRAWQRGVLADAAAGPRIHSRFVRPMPQGRRSSRCSGVDRRASALRNPGMPRLPQAERRGRKHRS